jgi:hypothetical protein
MNKNSIISVGKLKAREREGKVLKEKMSNWRVLKWEKV